MTNTDDPTERDVREVIRPGALRHERRRRLAERATARKNQRRREVFICPISFRHGCNCQPIKGTRDASTTTDPAHTEEENKR